MDNDGGTRFSLHLANSVVDTFDLTGEEGPILKTSQGENFPKRRISLASTASDTLLEIYRVLLIQTLGMSALVSC